MTNLPLLEKDEHRQDFGKKLRDKRSDAKRMQKQSAKGNLWKYYHREESNEWQRKYRLENGKYSQLIEQARNPIKIYSDNILVTSDWHIPLQDNNLVGLLLWVAEEYGVKDLGIIGDFYNCDAISKYTPLGPVMGFQEEKDCVRDMINLLLEHFLSTYFCRGNHEKRWLDLNAGHVTMNDLFSLTEIPKHRYKVTQDDHMHLFQDDQCWLLCHPKSYRQTNLSVAKDLAAKHHCNVGVAHGHQFAQGWDRSGRYRIFDMGGLFDKKSIDYLRETTTHPETKSGFYLIQDNNLYPFEL
jgi:hypothetical protein